ncbi:MAG: CFI-box-CTERM domain-containing protein [bacterium]
MSNSTERWDIYKRKPWLAWDDDAYEEERLKEERERSKLLADIREREKKNYESFHSNCFIATAAYGTRSSLDELNTLYKFRDTVLLKTSLGYKFVKSYYNLSPPIANYISKRHFLRMLTRIILTPLVWVIEGLMSAYEKK